jgi:exosome complex RNA-binding protein Rrp42 (RNase PH superfamily)
MFLDATLDEESISSNKLILAYTEEGKKIANVIQTGGKSEIGFDLLRSVIRVS